MLYVAELGMEGVDSAVATVAQHFLLHSADGLHGDPEPRRVAVRGELGAESESLPVGFPVGVERRQGARAAGPHLARSFDDDRRNDRRSVAHACLPSLPS